MPIRKFVRVAGFVLALAVTAVGLASYKSMAKFKSLEEDMPQLLNIETQKKQQTQQVKKDGAKS